MNRIPRILSLPVPSVLSRPRLRRVLLLPALLLVLAACSGDDEPAFTLPPQEDLQEVTLYLNLPALADSASKRAMGDPGTEVEEKGEWNTLVLFIVYLQSDVTPQEVHCETLTQAEYDALPPSKVGSPYKQYTLTVPAGTVSFYGLTYYSPAAGDDSYLGASALESAIKACGTKKEVEALTISNYYPYNGSGTATDVNKFCGVASGYYQNADGENSYTINYSHISADPQQIPTLTLRRLAAKIDIQWDAEAAYSEGDVVQPSVESFQFMGRTEGKVFPELNNPTTVTSKTWDFYNTTPISQRFGRVYHYTFPDGSLAPKVTFTVKTNADSRGKQYTLQWNTADYLRRATWYKVNATVNGNTTGGTIIISGWNDGTSFPGN